MKSLLLAGIIAAGVFAGAFGGIQLLNASAQTNQTSSENEGSQPVDPISTHTAASSTTGSTVSTSGTAKTKVQPDKFTVTVGVETNGTTAAEAASANADLTAAVVAALKALGIAESNISTSSYSVYPVYSSKEPINACRVMEGYPIPPECYVNDQEITGYIASNSVSVTLDADGDISAGEVIDTPVEAGANTVSGAYFFLSQERQLEVQEGLIEEAIVNARHRADIAAGAVNMQVSGVKSISLNDVYFPIFSKGAELQAADTQILPGEQEVTMTVSVVYLMSGGSVGAENTTGTADSMTIAREFILLKLPSLGVEIKSELDLVTDMISHVSENELGVDYSVVDTNGDVHDGHIEVANGEVTVASLDGESIL
jgi:uncharacterized protein YggE